MKLEEYKLIIIAVGLIGVLLFASPVLGMVLKLPTGEKFSELYLLGPGHMAEGYPFNVAVGENYSVYIGVGNHLSSSAYYVLYVKLRNESEPLPNSTTATPSPLPPLFEYRFFLADGENWESLFVFAIGDVSISGNQSTIRQLIINNEKFDLNKSATWNSINARFSYELFFELWLYDDLSNSVQFNNRFVGLQLNLTSTL